jgi:hypothetical protein
MKVKNITYQKRKEKKNQLYGGSAAVKWSLEEKIL